MELVERIKEYRKKKGLTQYQVAEMLGEAQSNYAYFEGGKREITYSKIVKLAEIFGVSVIELLGEGASVVVSGGNGEEAREVEALKKEVERLQIETGLHKQLKENADREKGMIYEKIHGILYGIEKEIALNKALFCGYPIPTNELKDCEEFDLGIEIAFPANQYPFIKGDVKIPDIKDSFVKNNGKYLLVNLIESTLLEHYFFTNKAVKLLFNEKLVIDTSLIERHNSYKSNRKSIRHNASLIEELKSEYFFLLLNALQIEDYEKRLEMAINEIQKAQNEMIDKYDWRERMSKIPVYKPEPNELFDPAKARAHYESYGMTRKSENED